MKRGSQVTIKIEKTEFPSVGISEFEGKKLYIKGAFPGQTKRNCKEKKRYICRC